MHELSIAISIVEIAEEYAVKNKAVEVKEIEIEIGSLAGVVIDALDFAMGAAIKNTICERSKWTIIETPAKSICPLTQKEYVVEQLYEPCPYCNEYGHDLIQGRELRVKSLIID